MMKVLLNLWILALAGPALAEPTPGAQEYFTRGLKWQVLGQPQKAIEAFEQSYQADENVLCLYHMAESYERIARTRTKTTPEVLDSRQKALDLYEHFIEQQQAEVWPSQLGKARARIKSLRQEIDELSTQSMADQRVLAQKLDALLLGQKVVVDRLDAIQGLLMQIARDVATLKAAKH